MKSGFPFKSGDSSRRKFLGSSAPNKVGDLRTPMATITVQPKANSSQPQFVVVIECGIAISKILAARGFRAIKLVLDWVASAALRSSVTSYELDLVPPFRPLFEVCLFRLATRPMVRRVGCPTGYRLVGTAAILRSIYAAKPASRDHHDF